MRVLVGCEYSGTVRDAFAAKGHDAWSCDILPSETPGQHYQGDVLDILNEGWDLFIGHPPCTFLTNSGARWLYNSDGTKNTKRWGELHKAANFFLALLNAPVDHIALENPIMHLHARRLVGKRQNQVIQPWQFGHGETKATCLWLKNLPLLRSTNVVEGRVQKMWLLPPGPDRWKLRSKTYQGIANAMADQWSEISNYQLTLFSNSKTR